MEKIVEMPFEKRKELINSLKSNSEWEESMKVNSNKNSYFLFINKRKQNKIAVNNGEDPFFDTVVYNNNSIDKID